MEKGLKEKIQDIEKLAGGCAKCGFGTYVSLVNIKDIITPNWEKDEHNINCEHGTCKDCCPDCGCNCHCHMNPNRHDIGINCRCIKNCRHCHPENFLTPSK